MKLTRTQRGRTRRLRRRLAAEDLAVVWVAPTHPTPSLMFLIGPADGSKLGRHFREVDVNGQWDEWISYKQAARESAGASS